ncbi:MAG: hypothetical protein ACRDOK_02690 [Streptosporangiaceae bacterium]
MSAYYADIRDFGIIELGHYDPHQLRDSHGRFARNPLSVLKQPAGPAPEEKKAHRELEYKTILAGAKADSAQAQLAELKKQAAEQKMEIRHLMTAVRRVNQNIADLGKQKETKTLRKRLAIHAGILLGSAALTAVTAGAGAPALVMVGAAVGPSFLSEIVDFFKGL